MYDTKSYLALYISKTKMFAPYHNQFLDIVINTVNCGVHFIPQTSFPKHRLLVAFCEPARHIFLCADHFRASDLKEEADSSMTARWFRGSDGARECCRQWRLARQSKIYYRSSILLLFTPTFS